MSAPVLCEKDSFHKYNYESKQGHVPENVITAAEKNCFK